MASHFLQLKEGPKKELQGKAIFCITDREAIIAKREADDLKR